MLLKCRKPFRPYSISVKTNELSNKMHGMLNINTHKKNILIYSTIPK